MNHVGFRSGWWEQALSQPRVSTEHCFLILLVVDSFLRQMCELIGTQPSIWGRFLYGSLGLSLYTALSCPFLCHANSHDLIPTLAPSFTWDCWLCSSYFSFKVISCGCCRAYFTFFLPTKDHCPSAPDFQCLENHHFLNFAHFFPFKGKGMFSPCDWFHIGQKAEVKNLCP